MGTLTAQKAGTRIPTEELAAESGPSRPTVGRPPSTEPRRRRSIRLAGVLPSQSTPRRCKLATNGATAARGVRWPHVRLKPRDLIGDIIASSGAGCLASRLVRPWRSRCSCSASRLLLRNATRDQVIEAARATASGTATDLRRPPSSSSRSRRASWDPWLLGSLLARAQQRGTVRRSTRRAPPAHGDRHMTAPLPSPCWLSTRSSRRGRDCTPPPRHWRTQYRPDHEQWVAGMLAVVDPTPTSPRRSTAFRSLDQDASVSSRRLLRRFHARRRWTRALDELGRA